MSNPQSDDSQIRTAVQQIERAFAAGERAEADRLLAGVQSVAGEHPLVLYAAGVQALHDGDARMARERLERAIAQDNTSPALWVNLATAFRMLELRDEEMRCLERALAIEPRHLFAFS